MVICMFADEENTVLVAKKEDWDRLVDNAKVFERKKEEADTATHPA